MPHIHVHPAAGLGDLLPGWFSVPQNPIRAVSEGISYVPHIGELMPGRFTVPQNPLRAELNGCSTIRPNYGQGMAGCGCSGANCESGLCGMGQLEFLGAGGGTMLAAGAGLLLLFMLMKPGGARYRAERSKLQQSYSEQSRALKSKYRGYKRAGRRAAGVVRGGLRAATA